MNLHSLISSHVAYDEDEKASQRSFLQFLDKFDPKDWAVRENLIGHLTSSAWVVNQERTKVLFAFHNLYNSWAWLGGHADDDLDLLHVAQKEAMEESGILKVTPLLEVPLDISVLNVGAHIKKGIFVPSHLHFNVAYVLEANEAEFLQHQPDENAAVAWINNDEVLSKVAEDFMKPIYQRIMNKVKQL